MESARKAKEYIKENIRDKAEKEKEAKKKKKVISKPYTKKELEELKKIDEIYGTDLYNDYLRDPQGFRERQGGVYKGGAIQKKARGGSVDYRKTGMFCGRT
jgi:hypothetical protein